MKTNRLPSLIALKAFEAVARVGSMKDAANELYVTPGAISQLIKKLEDELDVKLFERRNRDLELTSEGKILSEGTCEAFNILSQTVNAIPSILSQNTVVITCEASLATNWLAPRLNALFSLVPDSNIEILVHHNSSELQQQRFDIAISNWELSSSKFSAQCIGDETFSVYGSPDYIDSHRVTECSKELNTTLLNVCFDNQCKLPTWRDWYSDIGSECQLRHRQATFGDQVDQALMAARCGTGLLLAPNAVMENDVERGLVKRLSNRNINSNRHYWLIEQCTSDATTSCIKDALVREVKQSLALVEGANPTIENQNVIQLRSNSTAYTTLA